MGLNALLEVDKDILLQGERDLLVCQLENGAQDLAGPNDEELIQLINWAGAPPVLSDRSHEPG